MSVFYNTLSTYLFVKNEEFQFLELVETIDRELELEKYIYIYTKRDIGNEIKSWKWKLFVHNWRLFVEFLVVQSSAVEKYRLNIFPVNPWGCLLKVREGCATG